MAKKRFRKGRRSLRRRRRSYRKKSQRTTLVNRSLQPFPSRYLCKMKYSATVRINTPSISYSSWVFRINSLYDPDVSGVGHQQYGRDTLALIYNRYRVVSCRYNIQAIAAAGKTQILTIIPTNETLSESDVDALREKPRARSGVVCAGAAGVPTRFKGKVYLPSLVGKTRSQYMSDDRYSATFPTEPNETCYLYVHAMDMDKTTVADVYVTCTFEFLVECFDSHVLPQS